MGSPVVAIETSHSSNKIVVCTGTRAEIYDTITSERLKTFNKSKEPVLAATFRSDGKLLAIGNAIGQIFLFDVESKLLLRTLLGHSGPIRGLRFLSNKMNLVSTSDDQSVRLWDIAMEAELSRFDDSTDYVRSIDVCHLHPSLFIAGSYDGFSRIYDAQFKNIVMQLHHGDPVEAVCLISEGALAVTAGGNSIKFWNLTSGGALITSLECHQKTITSLRASDDGCYIVSGSLDHQIKVIRLNDFKVVHSWNFPAAVMSLSFDVLLNYPTFILIFRDSN